MASSTTRRTIKKKKEIHENEVWNGNPNTFKDLYEYIQDKIQYIHTYDDFKSMMEYNFNGSSTGKEIQESLFRLFSYLRLISDFDGYQLPRIGCNFSNQEYIFFDLGETNIMNEIKNMRIKDTGDKSDLTLYRNINGKNEYIISTSKK